jgi:DNA-binding transcriptional ArsR family regulator
MPEAVASAPRFGDDLGTHDLDNYLSMANFERGETTPDVDIDLAIDWAPAYELLVSFMTFAERDKHCIEELGNEWLTRARHQLPSDFNRLQFKAKQDSQLLLRLVRGCAADRDAAPWLDWLAALSPGAAYEVLASVTPADADAQPPRDFAAWRDLMVSLLRTWHDRVFTTLDPTILDGLRAECDALCARLGSMPPRELVEEVSNGIWIDDDPEMHRVVLVPQFHQRPYNDDCTIADGMLLLYPADSVARPADGPPLGLLRLTRALSDESRLRILRFLTQGSKSLTDVARFAGLSQPTVHHHLARLRAAGLVRVHVAGGHARRYSLRSYAFDQLSSQLSQYLEVTG